MMTQKGDLYSNLFNTFSEVRLVFCILPQLNILCRSLVKPYYISLILCKEYLNMVTFRIPFLLLIKS